MLLEKEAGCRDCYREKAVTGPKKIQSLAFSLSRPNGGGKKREEEEAHCMASIVQGGARNGREESSQIKTKLQSSM